MDKTNRRSTNTPTVPVSPTSSSAVFVVNEVVDGGNGKEQDAISAVPIGGIHAAYVSLISSVLINFNFYQLG